MFIELRVHNEDNERELEYKVNSFLAMIDFFALPLRYAVHIRWKPSPLNHAREDLSAKEHLTSAKRPCLF